MSRKWGQHFLSQSHYVEKILTTAQVKEGDAILEIGPGTGILTKSLLRQKADVTAIEIDPKLCQKLSQQVEQQEPFIGTTERPSAFRLIEQDVLTLTPQQLVSLYPSPFKVIANLPYNISTPIFFKLLTFREHLQSITVMVQKEVAERICANVSDGKNYGVLSIAANIGFHRNYSFTVPPSAFTPPPKVDSAVIHLVPKTNILSPEKEILFLKWIQCVFNQRRKTLLNNLRRCSPSSFSAYREKLTRQYSQRRSETLTLEEFIDLFDLLHSSSINGT